MTDAPRIAVVGGGVGGLLAAIRVAASGARTVLFEAAPHLGGRARTRRVGGFSLNQGPHALYRKGAFHAALVAAGVPVAGGPPDLAAGIAVWGDAAHPFPLSAVRPVPDPLDECAAAALRAFLATLASGGEPPAGTALRAALDTLPPRAREVVASLVRLTSYADAPDELDARAALRQLRLSFGGTVYVDGGWSTLVDGLARVAERSRIDVRTRARVARVVPDEGGLEVRFTGADHETFDAAILVVAPSQALALTGGAPALAARVPDLRPVRMSGLDVALSSVPRLSASFALGMTSSLYLSIHSASARLAPDGMGLMHLGRYLAPDEPPGARHVDEARGFADALQPGWRDRVVYEQRLSGAVVAHDLPQCRLDGRRVGLDGAGVPGVFLAGDWIGQEGMLSDASAASAREAADAALAFAATRRAPCR